MADEMVRYEDRDGAQIVLTPNDVAMYCASGNAQLTQRDVVNFMATCKALGANPYLGDVYLVKYSSGENAQIMAGKNYYTRVAVSIPTYDGMDAGIVCVTQQGELVYRRGSLAMPGDNCIGGWAEVHDSRWSHPVRAEVAMDEYNSHRSLWKSKPLTMIRKVALVQALREAYPDRFAGTYDASEMGKAGEVSPPQPAEVQAEVEQPLQPQQPAKPTPTPKEKARMAEVEQPQQPQQPAKPTPEEKARMAEVAEVAASTGIDLKAAKQYIWGLYQTNGMASVETWAAQIAPQPAPGSAQWAAQTIEASDPGARAVAVGNTVLIADAPEPAYEQAVEPDLYDTDASF